MVGGWRSEEGGEWCFVVVDLSRGFTRCRCVVVFSFSSSAASVLCGGIVLVGVVEKYSD